MSDERLQELGIPRRRFLKRTAAAAFVAPVVVSFGMDGVAEAHYHSFPNQTFPNQTCPNQTFSNQSVAENDLVEMIRAIVNDVQAGMLDFGRAHDLAEKALDAALELAAGHQNGACAKIDELVRETSRPGLSSLAPFAIAAQSAAGCACAPMDRHHHRHHDDHHD